MVRGGYVAHHGTCIPSCLSISSPLFSILLSQLLFPSQGLMDGLGTVRWASHLVVVELKTTRCAFSRLAEFQTPIIFDCDCDLNRSKTYRRYKIAKIINNTFCINVNVYIILFQPITVI